MLTYIQFTFMKMAAFVALRFDEMWSSAVTYENMAGSEMYDRNEAFLDTMKIKYYQYYYS